jgi:hypothetical protein
VGVVNNETLLAFLIITAFYRPEESHPHARSAIFAVAFAADPFSPMTTTTSTTYSTTTRHTLSRRKGPGLGTLASASTPNLNHLYSSHSAASSRLALPSLSRKPSFPALTQNSLASIPDDTEAYASSVLTNDKMPAPLTPGRPGAGEGLGIGDAVDVPGNMHGTVRFIGSVAGRKGTFAGVELHPDFAMRGKNSGDVDG